ncbi:hypothetical protein FHG87_008523 [Trinorchestia longiramus]|nr:hypothetical protein FHG87_008523 [Trinorchestia longiramus]
MHTLEQSVDHVMVNENYWHLKDHTALTEVDKEKEEEDKEEEEEVDKEEEEEVVEKATGPQDQRTSEKQLHKANTDAQNNPSRDAHWRHKGTPTVILTFYLTFATNCSRFKDKATP